MFISLFSNLLSRPAHGQHRHDGMKAEPYKAGLHSPQGQALDSIEPVSLSRGFSPPSPQISSCCSTVSLPSNFLCKTHSLPSVLDTNETNFSDTISESINDPEDFTSSVWKLFDLTSLLSVFSLILFFYFKTEVFFFFFLSPYCFSLLSTLCYSHIFLS